LDVPELPPHNLQLKVGSVGHDASKPKPTKTMQWNAFGD